MIVIVFVIVIVFANKTHLAEQGEVDEDGVPEGDGSSLQGAVTGSHWHHHWVDWHQDLEINSLTWCKLFQTINRHNRFDLDICQLCGDLDLDYHRKKNDWWFERMQTFFSWNYLGQTFLILSCRLPTDMISVNIVSGPDYVICICICVWNLILYLYLIQLRW